MNEYSKYKLFRKYKTEDGVKYTPLDEYQALSDGSTNNCDCGYREYEYIDTNEDVCSCVITDNDIVENEPSDDNLLKPYRKYIEIEKCPYDESYNQETGAFKYVGSDTPSLDCANCDDINLLFEWSGTTWINLEGDYTKKSPKPSITSSPYGTYSDPSYGALPDYITKLIRHPNTSKFTSMNNMFYNCTRLTDANLSSFDTSNVTSMYYMFDECYNLTSIDLSSFNTPQVTNMNGMFNKCSCLTSLDLSSFNTSAVTDMSRMFSHCYKLTSLNLSNWDTSNVTKMTNMFERCSGLTEITINNVDCDTFEKIGDALWNSSYEKSPYYIDITTNIDCINDTPIKLRVVDIINDNFFLEVNGYTAYISTNSKYFTLNDDGSYTFTITLKDLFQTNMTNFTIPESGGWYDVTSVYSLPVTNSTTKLQFEDIEYLNSEGWDTSSITNMEIMFSGCTFDELDLSGWDVSNVTDISSMFTRCSIQTLNLSGWDLSKAKDAYSIFSSTKPGKIILTGCSDYTKNEITRYFKNNWYSEYTFEDDVITKK